MKHSYMTEGVCPNQIDFEVENGLVKNVNYQSGCDGNLKALGTLVDGMKVEDVIKKLQGIKCGSKNTSCADQLARALKVAND